jgi:hypothetical protein
LPVLRAPQIVEIVEPEGADKFVDAHAGHFDNNPLQLTREHDSKAIYFSLPPLGSFSSPSF